MIRKVIKQANQAYTITLPVEWVRQNNIDKNKEVDVQTQDKSLIVSNVGGVSLKKAVLPFGHSEKSDYDERTELARKIHAMYAKGIDEIEIHSAENISSKLVDVMTELIGYALVSQDKEVYIIKDIGGGSYSDLDEIFKRVFQMVIIFYESAIEDMFGKEEETKESLDNRDREINKFCLFLERAINKMSYSDPVNGRGMFTYSFSLEKIGDEIHRLWRANILGRLNKTDKLKKILLLSKEGLGLSFDFYYSNNFNVANKIYKLKEQVRKESESLSKQEFFEFGRHAVKIIEDVADLSHLNLLMK